MKKKKNSKITFAVIPAGLILAAGIAFLSAGKFSNQDDSYKENVARLKKLEQSDITQTENQLKKLKQEAQSAEESAMQDSLSDENAILSDIEIKQAFQNTVILGDSITESIVEYGFLGTDVVIGKRGLSIQNASEQIKTAIGLNPDIIFMAFGANDLELFQENSEAFIDAYREQIHTLKESLPDAKIYINSILPLQESAIAEIPSLAYYPDYNQALEAFCQEEELTYLDESFIVENNQDLYEPDGEHVVRDYYPKWLTYMAKTAGVA